MLLPLFSLSCCAGAGNAAIESSGIAATDANKIFLIALFLRKNVEQLEKFLNPPNVPMMPQTCGCERRNRSIRSRLFVCTASGEQIFRKRNLPRVANVVAEIDRRDAPSNQSRPVPAIVTHNIQGTILPSNSPLTVASASRRWARDSLGAGIPSYTPLRQEQQ